MKPPRQYVFIDFIGSATKEDEKKLLASGYEPNKAKSYEEKKCY